MYGLICAGTYLFVGAPKVGKSFFMAYQRNSHVGAEQLLPDMDIQPNVLTRKLNIGAERLFVDYGIEAEWEVILW